MNPSVARPFLVLSSATVAAAPWLLSVDDGDWTEAGRSLPKWDMSACLRARRTLLIDWDKASADLGIPEDQLSLGLGIQLGTGTGRLPRLAVLSQTQELDRSADSVTVELQVDGVHLSAILELRTELFVAAPSRDAGTLSPGSAGDLVWDDRIRVLLEGDGPRFPVEAVAFSEVFAQGTARNAPWHIHWTPADWHRDFHGALQLFLNTERSDIVERLREGDALLMQAVLADAMTQVCTTLLLEEDFEDLAAGAEDGTLIAQALHWLKLAFPLNSLPQSRELARHRPGEFRACLLALSEIGAPLP